MVAHGTLNIPQGGGKLFVGNGIAYVTTVKNFAQFGFVRGGYATVDVADSDNLVLISGPDIPGNEAEPSTAIVTNGSGIGVLVGSLPTLGAPTPTLALMNVSDPSNTDNELLQYSLPAIPYDVAIASGIAYVAGGTAGLQVVNYLPFDSKSIPPTINISADKIDVDPVTPGIQVIEGRTVPIRADIQDDVQVRNVELLVNGQVVQNDVSFPFDLLAVAGCRSVKHHGDHPGPSDGYRRKRYPVESPDLRPHS